MLMWILPTLPLWTHAKRRRKRRRTLRRNPLKIQWMVTVPTAPTVPTLRSLLPLWRVKRKTSRHLTALKHHRPVHSARWPTARRRCSRTRTASRCGCTWSAAASGSKRRRAHGDEPPQATHGNEVAKAKNHGGRAGQVHARRRRPRLDLVDGSSDVSREGTAS